MCKSTQDLSIWLNNLTAEITKQGARKVIPVLGIEVFADKSFRIAEYEGVNVIYLYESDADELYDVNDIGYVEPEQFAKLILDNQSVANIKASDL